MTESQKNDLEAVKKLYGIDLAALKKILKDKQESKNKDHN